VTLNEGHLVRPFKWDEWPIGMGQIALEGPGIGIYRSDVRFPGGWSTAFLKRVVESTDRFLRVMTDPARWRREDGRYDHATRRLTWASIVYGLQAISDMAQDWTARHAMWDAFRALGTLQGIWEGDRQGAIGLSSLLDPNRLRATALHAFADPLHRRWCEAIINNYERALITLSPASDPHEGAVRLAEIRHLLHGVQAQGGRHGMLRFAILEHMDSSESDIQLVKDMAAFWWSAVIFDPERFCNPGLPPWNSSAGSIDRRS
jgi:hypothetical protein